MLHSVMEQLVSVSKQTDFFDTKDQASLVLLVSRSSNNGHQPVWLGKNPGHSFSVGLLVESFLLYKHPGLSGDMAVSSVLI